MSSNQSSSSSAKRRVALVADARHYVGPDLARMLAARQHDLVLGDASEELLAECRALGSTAIAVSGVSNMAKEQSAQTITDVALQEFGVIDAAVIASGQIIPGRFVDSTMDQFEKLVEGCMYAPFNFLKAVIPPMIEQKSGQVLVITSAAGLRTLPGAALYSSVRAGATMLARNVAAEVARFNVQVNAVGTNFMDFPEFLTATGATDPAVRAKIEEQVPMKRLGRLDEFANFCGVFLDGSSTFTTGQYVGYSGGWV